jgi:hypothetical protein
LNSSRENLRTRIRLIVKKFCFHASLNNRHVKSVPNERFRF